MVSAASTNLTSESLQKRALSDWHQDRMEEHANIVPVVSKQQRLTAIGNINEFRTDRVCTYMSKYAEQIFEPKRILSDEDWLNQDREPDQRFEYHMQGKNNIKWLNSTKNKIYLFIADKSFTKKQITNYQKYVSAFFTGIKSVEIIKEGAVIPGQFAWDSKQKRVPDNFLKTQIAYRDAPLGCPKQYKTSGYKGILNTMTKYRPRDSYAMQLITKKDLYPGPRSSFCFGGANFTEGVAALSFCRYDPSWDGIEDPEAEQNLLMRGCAILCQKIGHQLGLSICNYYECLMNGNNSAEEQRNGGIRILCPICQQKLKQNLKFDSAERFQNLINVCDELGFYEEAAIYRKLLKDAAELAPLDKSINQNNDGRISQNSSRKRESSNDARQMSAASSQGLVGFQKVSKTKPTMWL